MADDKDKGETKAKVAPEPEAPAKRCSHPTTKVPTDKAGKSTITPEDGFVNTKCVDCDALVWR